MVSGNLLQVGSVGQLFIKLAWIGGQSCSTFANHLEM
jgi:hypothetical protein